MMRVTLEQIRTAVSQVVAEAGADTVYKIPEDIGKCVYVDIYADAPSCLIGQALYRCGVPLDRMAHWDSLGWSAMALPVWKDPDACFWATHLQDVQDTGTPWGRAVEYADKQMQA